MSVAELIALAASIADEGRALLRAAEMCIRDSYGGAHFQAVMARQRHERVVLIAAWREGRL